MTTHRNNSFRPLAPMLRKEDVDALERMIDDYHIVAVVDALGALCVEKSEHIATNWQDTALADMWTGIAAVLCGASFKVQDGPRMVRLANGAKDAA